MGQLPTPVPVGEPGAPAFPQLEGLCTQLLLIPSQNFALPGGQVRLEVWGGGQGRELMATECGE